MFFLFMNLVIGTFKILFSIHLKTLSQRKDEKNLQSIFVNPKDI
jgi:hypothetical protein